MTSFLPSDTRARFLMHSEMMESCGADGAPPENSSAKPTDKSAAFKHMFHEISGCRSCGGKDLREVLAFGDMPLADGLRDRDSLSEVEPHFPLTVDFCESCSLIQIRENVDTSLLFGTDYPYFSSFSDAWVSHCRDNALEIIESRSLNSDSLVVELACNDGYMLKHFKEKGVNVLGVDPAPGPAAAAREQGIEVIEDFFTTELAEKMVGDGVKADVVIGNNVLAHVPDLPGFVRGIATVLKQDGVAVIECPYVRDLIDHREFDTIYHEHHCYFSITALAKLCQSQGLSLNGVRRLPTHGGSIRLFIEPTENVGESVKQLLAEEAELGMDTFAYYETFAERVRSTQSQLVSLLRDLKSKGHSVAAYAAAAKGATLLNSMKVGSETLDYVVDRNRHKHGRYMPGTEIEVRDTSVLLEDQPDFVLMLAWNFKEEIMRQQSEFRAAGGKFIVPIPEPEIV